MWGHRFGNGFAIKPTLKVVLNGVLRTNRTENPTGTILNPQRSEHIRIAYPAAMSEALAKSAFIGVCDDLSGALSVFECKCALVRALGVTLPVREIGNILQNQCAWKRDGSGVRFNQFLRLYQIVDTSHKQSGLESDHYAVFDNKNKGWINERDVYLVCNFANTASCLYLLQACLFIRVLHLWLPTWQIAACRSCLLSQTFTPLIR